MSSYLLASSADKLANFADWIVTFDDSLANWLCAFDKRCSDSRSFED